MIITVKSVQGEDAGPCAGCAEAVGKKYVYPYWGMCLRSLGALFSRILPMQWGAKLFPGVSHPEILTFGCPGYPAQVVYELRMVPKGQSDPNASVQDYEFRREMFSRRAAGEKLPLPLDEVSIRIIGSSGKCGRGECAGKQYKYPFEGSMCPSASYVVYPYYQALMCGGRPFSNILEGESVVVSCPDPLNRVLYEVKRTKKNIV